MSKKIKLIIDGKEVEAHKGDTILEAARRNGIYIPTMCYLPKVKPIASCRVCVVEVEGMKGSILSCQEKAIDGIVVRTNSKELFTQRQNILKLYDVNHPLQCGVCPKSGECDLQNKTLEFKVTSQEFSAKEQKRQMQEWGNITYDPYLCILCERCVRVSNEIIGDEALQVKAGGYNSTIINVKADDKNIDWGECAAVCPVGALSDKDFKYFVNAWELTPIPASCMHTPLANLIYYEVKNEKIYRVKSEYEFDSISGICRYGYDFENRGKNTKEDLDKCVENFKKADTIRFTSMITNEEALILQKLKEKYGYKLINKEAKNYQDFLKSFSTTAGVNLYNGVSKEIKHSDFIITFGTKIADDVPGIKFKINEAVKKNKAIYYYLHPIEDEALKGIVSTHIKYEVGTEEGVLALLAKAILMDKKLPKKVQEFLDGLDDGYLSAESNVGEEEIQRLKNSLKRKKSPYLIVGSDVYAHPRAKNIAKIIGLIQKHSDFKVILIPTFVNTLGVSLICDLDEKEGEYSIAYNDEGDFILSAIEDKGDVNMPALNQQEGTFTSLDKKVVPTNVALAFDGFCLNDIANKLGIEKRYTIDYTKELPKEKGYKAEDFDHLPNYFTNNGEEIRGYELEVLKAKIDNTSIDEVAELGSYDGVVVYSVNPNYQKNIFTNLCSYLPKDSYLVGSSYFATAAKIKDGDKVKFEIDGLLIEKEFKLDKNLKGTVALLPNFDLGFSGQRLFSGYRYNKIKVEQVG